MLPVRSRQTPDSRHPPIPADERGAAPSADAPDVAYGRRSSAEDEDVSTTPTPRNLSRSFWVLAADVTVVLVAALFICLYQIGDGSFGSGDQTTHVRVVQQMHYSGDLLHPFYDGRPYYNKPPFKMWLSLIPLAIWGESNFSYRVIDGLSGVFIALTLFFFARSVFRSRLIAYLSVCALFSSRLFFYGHGVRNAVQDGMMLLLMTLGTVIGYSLVERLRSDPLTTSSSRRSVWSLALLGGVVIGLGALTKNVAAYFAFVITAVYALGTGGTLQVLKRGWAPILSALGVSLAIPAAYILAQGKLATVAFQMLLITEVYKRATKGYHFVHHDWYYWNGIVHDRQAVPPELLLIGVAVALFFVLRRRDRRFTFLLSWAVVPVVVQSIAKSKLLWYLLPALPGMCLLVGASVGTLLIGGRNLALNTRLRATPRRLAAVSTLLLALVTAGTLAHGTYQVIHLFMWEQHMNEADAFVADIKAYEKRVGRRLPVILYDPPVLARHEVFYFRQLQTETLGPDPAALAARLARGDVGFVITRIPLLPEIAGTHPFTTIANFGPKGKRRRWMTVLGFNPELLPRNFTPRIRRYSLRNNPEMVAFGMKQLVPVNLLFVRPTKGARTGFLLPGSFAEHNLRTSLSINLASVVPAANGKLFVKVFLNDRPIATLEEVEEGFHERSISIAPAMWQEGTNLLTLVFHPPGRRAVQAEEQLALIESISYGVDPGSDDPASKNPDSAGTGSLDPNRVDHASARSGSDERAQ